ncbi:uncharacterized protein [Chironomus tepperi]|uniref:uncharacterized protein isoform X3 n=1 Tax=Chironomus tepperi TaxID=113505 RepID=UPI00391F60D8
MKINLIWINLFSIIYIVNIGGASDSVSDNDLNVYDEDEELNYNEIKSLTTNSPKNKDNENLMKKLYSSKKIKDTEAEENSVRLRNTKIKKHMPKAQKDERAVKVAEQSTELQVELQMNNESGITQSKTKTSSAGKRKTFSNKRKRKKKRKQPKQKEEDVRGVKNENFSRYDMEDIEGRSNYENVSNVSMITSSIQTSRKEFSTTTMTDAMVMEMVEAVIDNNNNNNNNNNNKNVSRDSDVNLWNIKSENEFVQNVGPKLHKSTNEQILTVNNIDNVGRDLKSGDLNEAKSVKMESLNLNNDNENEIKSKSRKKSSIISSGNKNKTNEMKINKHSKQGSGRRRKRKFIIGDLSCMKAQFIQAPRIANADIKYIRNEMMGIGRSFLEAEYHCHDGYKLIKKFKRTQIAIANKNLVCKKHRWIGQSPLCRKIYTNKNHSELKMQQCDSYEAQKCEQLCIKSGNRTEVQCQCHKGFRLIGTRCFDVNECEENPSMCGQHGKCFNLVGAHKCLCQQGFQLDNAGKCIDINECLLRGGHGPCQDTCYNSLGSYTCSCENLNGTQLSQDGHSCEEIDLCSINNGECSHTCHSTIGQAFCSCPVGFKLDIDWKTCTDVDECQLQESIEQEQRCNYECINTIGSYKCVGDIGADQPFSNEFNDYMIQNNVDDNYEDNYKTRKFSHDDSDDTDGNYDIIDGASSVSECLNGFYFNETVGDCQDINECEIDNGNCSNGTCVNTNGSFFCSCHKGFVLSEDDKYKCIEMEQSLKNETTMENLLKASTVACPPLFPPVHGYLECTRPLDNSNLTGRLIVTNRPGSQCVLRCPASYRTSGTYLRTCGEDGEWHGLDDGICIKYPTPKLICPSNQIVELPPHSDKVEVKLQKPKTDVNFKRDVTIKPLWIKNVDKIVLGLGELNITYTARHPITKLTVACTTTFFVVDGETPVVEYCPPSQKHKIEKHHESINVFWTEPKFSDNVKVTDVTQTNIPGSLFGLGSHQIIYEARDAAGYKTRCTFKIIVNAPKYSGLKLPIKNNKFYY